VPHDDDQLGAGQLAGELQAAEDVVVDEVPGHARHEQVADALIEDPLRRDE
jgi:hypothetical protein